MALEGLQERYVNFYTDFAFKKLFGTEVNKDLLISFLNALLSGEEEIKELTYCEHEKERKGIFSVYCMNEKGEHFLVEIQKAEQRFFKGRSAYYSTFPIREQGSKGNWNYELKSVYAIGILNFSFDDSDPNYYHHEVKLVNIKTTQVFYNKLTYIYLEMPKFRKTESELENLFEKWLYAIIHLPDLRERPQALRETVFEKFFRVAEIACFTQQERVAYERSLKNYRDWYSIAETAEYRGWERGYNMGLLEARAEARAKGRAEGRAEGRNEAKRLIAENMIKMGMKVNDVCRITGLSMEEVKRIRS